MELKIFLMMIYFSSQSFGMELEVPQFERNFGLSSRGYYIAYGWGLYSCARYCGKQAGCKSFTYNTEDLKCRFTEEDASTDPGQYRQRSGFIYGDRATILSSIPLMRACSNHDCPEYSSCVSLSSVSRVCVVTACGPSPGTPVNVNISPTMGLVGFPRQLHCDSGYQGFRTVMCLPNGNWSEIENTCTAVGCDIPPNVQNATISNGNTTIGSNRTYACDPNSITSGSGDITCQQNGTWTTSSLVCIQDCGNPPNISNAIISDGNTTQGSTRTYECIPASTASGSGDIQCNQDGRWSVTSLQCVPDCVVVTNMLNAITTATIAPAGTTIFYTCDTGYELTAGTGNRLCNSEGLWEALNITCSQTNGCGNPPSISNATISNGTTTVGSIRKYECVLTSTASGSGEITCQQNNTWTESSIECIPDCVIDPITNNAYTTATRAQANGYIMYTCMPDYVMTAGSGYRVCDAVGRWSLFDITCTHHTQAPASDQDG